MEIIDPLVRSVLQKESLQDCSLEELELLAKQYPYFAPAQVLLAEKLRSGDELLYKEQLKRLSLYFNNPLWFDYLLNGYKAGLATSQERKYKEALETIPRPEETEQPGDVAGIEDAAKPETGVTAEEHDKETTENEFIEIGVDDEEATGSESLSVTFAPPSSESIEHVEIENREQANERPGEAAEINNDEMAQEVYPSPGENSVDPLPGNQLNEEEIERPSNVADVEPEQDDENTPGYGEAGDPETGVKEEGGLKFKLSSVADMTDEPIETDLKFEPYHTVDYFASQGIKFTPGEKPEDRFSKQLRSFTEWLKTMKRLPQSEVPKITDSASEEKVQQLAEHSIAEGEIVTETMAEVWEKQGNKEKAIEIYDKLSLLNPDKSAYFASLAEQLKNS